MARRPLDLYATPPEVAIEVCRLASAEGIAPAEILEPSAGPGRFIAAALQVWPGTRVRAVDVDGAHRDACLAAGAESFTALDWQAYAAAAVERRCREPWIRAPLLILGNPPFMRAQAHVEAALELLQEGEHLVFILRQSFRGAKERVAFWRRSPLLWVSTIVPRIPFIPNGEGGDTSDCEVFCWRKGHTRRAEVLPPMLWGKALEEDRAAQHQVELIGRAG